MKKFAVMMFITFLVLVADQGRTTRLITKQSSKRGSVIVLQDEGRILEQARKLKEDNKIEEALALLYSGMDQFPTSTQILNEALQIYLEEERYDEAIQLLDERVKNFQEKTQHQIFIAKQQILQPLIEPLLEEGNIEKAFSYLQKMADSGYRGFHQLRNNPLHEPLRRHSGFEEVMKKISKNSGLGKPALDFTVLLTSGSMYTLSAQKGKVVLVDFWSTSCPPCINEFSNISAIYQANKDKGFEVISISLDENKEKLDAFLTSNPMPWSTAFSGKGWNDDTAKLYEILTIPAQWLVDKNGVFRYFDVRGEDLKDAVEKLLKE